MTERALDTAQVLRTRAGVSVRLLPIRGLDDAAIAELGAIIQELIRDRDVDVIVDVVRAKTVSSQALEGLLDAHDELRENGGRLRVTNPNSILQEVLHLTGIENSIGVIRAAEAGKREAPVKQRLGDILVARELLTEDQLQRALELQRASDKRLGEIVIEEGWVDESEVLRALSQQIAVPEVNLRPGVFDPAVRDLIDARTAKRLKVVPLFKVRNDLTLATTNPQNAACLREVENLTHCTVRPVLASPGNILGLIDESSGDIDLGVELLAEVDDDFEVVETTIEDLDSMDEAAGSPIINLANSLIQRAVRDGASDVHIEPARDKCRIRFRIDGVLYEVMTLRPELRPALVSRLKVMADLDISERRLPQDGRIQVVTQGRSVDLRFSSLPGLYGEKVVLRVLDKNRAILELDKLGMRANNRDAYARLLECGYGLILVTGPTGSGKTTSLYAALNHMNSLEKNIVTIEDPVEYQLDIVNQNEVHANIGLSFARILKHVLRQDPDIIMVGEIREQETAEIAVQAALTGHLVLSTLHTNDSISAVTRMIDMGVEPYLLSSALIGVVAQRLVRTVCPSCKTTFIAPAEVLQRYGWDPAEKLLLARGRGCGECYDSGYKGRIAIHETLETTDDLQRLIMANPSRDELTAYLREHDVTRLVDDGLERVREQRTTIEEVSRVINS